MTISLLILCTGNSCRSQMAEGIARQLFSDQITVESAGTKPCFVHPLAIEVTKEIHIDLSTHHSKHADDLAGKEFDILITVCDNAKESCPIVPGQPKPFHWPFPDPADAKGTDDEILPTFRAVRDQILKRFQDEFPALLEQLKDKRKVHSS